MVRSVKKLAKQEVKNHSPPAVDREEYNKAVFSAKLLAIQLLSSNFDIKPDYFDSSIKKTLSFEYNAIGSDFDSEAGAVSGRFVFGCVAKSGNRYLLRSAAEYLVIYDLDSDMQDQAATTFCDRVGIFAAYPYFRALVAHLAWAAGADLPPLPVIATKGSPIAATNPKPPAP